MSDLSPEDREALIRLARSAIRAQLQKGASVERPREAGPALMEKRGCFVTLHLDGQLRGCIGVIDPTRSLMSEVEIHACHAAFRDPRFTPLTLSELPSVKIEVSVLTVPKPLVFEGSEDLLEKLIAGKHGVILSQEGCRATFLPQVWEQLPDKASFLTHLCLKAGLSGASWKHSNIQIAVYEAEYFSE